MSDLNSQVANLLKAITSRGQSLGLSHGLLMENAVEELFEWIHYYRSYYRDKSGAELIDGAHAAILEAIGCISLGLGRPALSAIRTQVDLILAFTYFCDHPREWQKLVNTGEGFKLRGDVYGYHADIDKSLGERLTIVNQICNPNLKDIYAILSAHIHGQSPYVMPNAEKLIDLVVELDVVTSIVELQRSTSIALSTYLVALHANEWADIPQSIVKRVKGLLATNQIKVFFR